MKLDALSLLNRNSYFKLYNIYKLSVLDKNVFTNDPGDRGSISGRVIPKTQKMVLNASLLNIQHYKVQIKGNWSNPEKGVAPSTTPWCSSYLLRSG